MRKAKSKPVDISLTTPLTTKTGASLYVMAKESRGGQSRESWVGPCKGKLNFFELNCSLVRE